MGEGGGRKDPFSITALSDDKYFTIKLHKANHSEMHSPRGDLPVLLLIAFCSMFNSMCRCSRMTAGCVTQGCFPSMLRHEAKAKRDNSHPIIPAWMPFPSSLSPKEQGLPLVLQLLAIFHSQVCSFPHFPQLKEKW